MNHCDRVQFLITGASSRKRFDNELVIFGESRVGVVAPLSSALKRQFTFLGLHLTIFSRIKMTQCVLRTLESLSKRNLCDVHMHARRIHLLPT